MAKRTMPIKTTRIELSDEYEGWWIDIQTNAPLGLLLDAMMAFQTAQIETPEDIQKIGPPLYDILELTIHKWNFVDEKGKDLPANREGIKRIGLDLLILLASQVPEVVVGLPLASSEK